MLMLMLCDKGQRPPWLLWISLLLILILFLLLLLQRRPLALSAWVCSSSKGGRERPTGIFIQV
jgi:hypothetical protein